MAKIRANIINCIKCNLLNSATKIGKKTNIEMSEIKFRYKFNSTAYVVDEIHFLENKSLKP